LAFTPNAISRIHFIVTVIIKTTSVRDGDARRVGGGRGWLAGDTDAGWPAGR